MNIIKVTLQDKTIQQVAEHLQNWFREYNKSPKVKIDKLDELYSLYFKDHQWQQHIMEIRIETDNKISCELYEFGNALSIMQSLSFQFEGKLFRIETNTIEIELNEMKSLLAEYNRVTSSTICSFDKNSIGYAELTLILTSTKATYSIIKRPRRFGVLYEPNIIIRCSNNAEQSYLSNLLSNHKISHIIREVRCHNYIQKRIEIKCISNLYNLFSICNHQTTNKRIEFFHDFISLRMEKWFTTRKQDMIWKKRISIDYSN